MTHQIPTTPRDDGLEWLRAIRRQMAAEAHNDPRVMGEQLREMEKQFADRMVRAKKSLEPVELH